MHRVASHMDVCILQLSLLYPQGPIVQQRARHARFYRTRHEQWRIKKPRADIVAAFACALLEPWSLTISPLTELS